MEDTTMQNELYRCVDKIMSIVADQAMNDADSEVPAFDTLIEFEDFISEEHIADDLYKILYKFYKRQYRYYHLTN